MDSHNPQFGISFSIKQCRNFDMDWKPILRALINDLGVKRFRLMSYWDEHESQQGKHNFTELDAQISMIERAGGVVTLCLGVRQPRWPENHWPQWAWQLPKIDRDKALLAYLHTVVSRYKSTACIISYQLENEALLTEFGERPDTDRHRLLIEYATIKRLDPKRPIIMTTSTSWGIPIRRPIPDIIGFSYYQIVYNKGTYSQSFHRPWLDRWRGRAIRLLHGKPSFIHELQAEPWGPQNIWEMTLTEQDHSMSLKQLKQNISHARATKLNTIDFWGAEWWYWRKTIHHDSSLWNHMKSQFML